MSNEKRRAYNSTARQAKASMTRRRILEAAKDLFQREGFELVTIEKLAEVAEVSAPTIYSIFRSKRGVLRTLLDEALEPDEYIALVEKAVQEESPRERLINTARLCRRMYDAETALMDLFRGASVLAPEFKQLEKEREERRYARQEESFMKMAKEKVLQKGLSIKKARDILWAFTGRDLYRLMVIERGWSSSEYEEWLGELLVRTLLQNR